jgi:hypothetical protein
MLAQTLGRPTAPTRQATQAGVTIDSPQAIVDDEIDRYTEEVDNAACTYDNVHEWWDHSKQIHDFPCLSQVASALFGMKPGAGGLECDIGSMGDVIGRRRSSLGPGIVEASMMIKLNKDRIVREDPMMVKEYRTSWKAKRYIPRTRMSRVCTFDLILECYVVSADLFSVCFLRH